MEEYSKTPWCPNRSVAVLVCHIGTITASTSAVVIAGTSSDGWSRCRKGKPSLWPRRDRRGRIWATRVRRQR